MVRRLWGSSPGGFVLRRLSASIGVALLLTACTGGVHKRSTEVPDVGNQEFSKALKATLEFGELYAGVYIELDAMRDEAPLTTSTLVGRFTPANGAIDMTFRDQNFMGGEPFAVKLTRYGYGYSSCGSLPKEFCQSDKPHKLNAEELSFAAQTNPMLPFRLLSRATAVRKEGSCFAVTFSAAREDFPYNDEATYALSAPLRTCIREGLIESVTMSLTYPSSAGPSTTKETIKFTYDGSAPDIPRLPTENPEA